MNRKLFVFAMVVFLIHPLISLPFVDSADSPRRVWAMATVSILLLLLLWNAVKRGEFVSRSDPIAVVLMAMAGAALISTFTAANPYLSYNAVVMIGFAAILYWVAVQGYINGDAISTYILPTIAAVSALLSVHTILRYYGVDLGEWGGNFRPLGNAQYEGAYCAMTIPVMLGAALSARGTAARAAYILSVVLSTAMLFSTGVLGAMVGASAAVAVAILLPLFRREPVTGKRALHPAALLIVVAFLSAAFFGYSTMAAADRISTGLRARGDLWGQSAAMALDNPFLGVGPGNFAIRFPPYGGEGTRNAEDCRNMYLAAFAEGGVVGILLLLFLVYAVLRRFQSYLSMATEPRDIVLLSGLGGASVAFALCGLFSSLNISALHLLTFLFFAAMTECVGDRRMHFRKRGAGDFFATSSAVVLISTGFLTFVAARDLLADGHRLEGQRAMAERRYPDAVVAFEKSIEWRFYDWSSYYRLGLAYKQLRQYNDAEVRFERALGLHPYFAPAYSELAALQLERGDGVKAEDNCRKALSISPVYPAPRFTLGLICEKRGEFVEALSHFKKTVELDPLYARGYFQVGEVLLFQGELASSLPWFKRAKERGHPLASTVDDLAQKSGPYRLLKEHEGFRAIVDRP